jgi:hypothetical protein
MVGRVGSPCCSRAARPTNHPCRSKPSGREPALGLLDLCWTSSGPRSRNETLEKWGLHCVVWTFWTSCPVGAGCRLLWRGRTVAGKQNPSSAGGAKQVQNVQRGGSTPVFSGVSLQDLCPAKVQTGAQRSRRGAGTGTLATMSGSRAGAGRRDGRQARPRPRDPAFDAGRAHALLCWFDRAGS